MAEDAAAESVIRRYGRKVKGYLTLRKTWPFIILIFMQLFACLYFVRPCLGPASSGMAGFPTDDAWVFLQYGRNFAEYGWFYYNEGQAAVGPSGWLWTVILAVGHWTLVTLGVSSVFMAKVMGLLLGLFTAVFIYHIFKRITGYLAVGLLAAVVVLLEPEFVYLELSGHSDGLTLIFSFTLAMLLLLNGRRWLLGLGLACLIWSRPEGSIFAALVIIVVLFLAVRKAFKSGKPGSFLSEIPGIIIPPVIAFGVWAGYTYAINGSIGSSGIVWITGAEEGVFPAERLGHLWSGYLSQLPWFSGIYAGVIIAIMIVTGAVIIIQRNGIVSVPLVLFPLMILYIYGAFVDQTGDPWQFWGLRRYVDPALPIILGLVTAGIVYWIRQLSKLMQERINNQDLKRWAPVISALLISAILIPHVINLINDWPGRQGEYVRDIAGIERVYAIPARFVDEYTPEDAIIAVGLGGATAYITDRHIVELVGAQETKYFGRPGYDIIADEKPDYFITFPDDHYVTSIPGAIISESMTDSPMLVFELDWSWEPDDPDASSLIEPGFSLLDHFAVADTNSSESHFYRSGEVAYDPRLASILPSGEVVIDRGFLRRVPNMEEFTMTVIQGQPIKLVIRYDAVIGGAAAVYVNDKPAGDWILPTGEYALNEAEFLIPTDLITGDNITFRLEWREGVSTFHYWTYAAEGLPQ